MRNTTEPPNAAAPAAGTLVISLDFELFWGMRDKRTVEEYGASIRGVRQAIPRLLEAFDAHQVRATFATVGLLFFDTKDAMVAGSPAEKPSYSVAGLSPYPDLAESVGRDEQEDPYHFGASLIRLIQAHPGHEVGCHTFSHYYCLEEGQTETQFAADLQAARHAAERFGITLRSFVFPRNQYQGNYLKICRDQGIACYRGNERSWLYDARSGEQESLFRRMFRLLDSWIDLSGPNCHDLHTDPPRHPLNIPSSRFLRPWNGRTRALEGLRMRRITKAMDHAARNGSVFHLWWHPHNFGKDLEQNMAFLERILQHFQGLQRTHGMRSMTMSELADEVTLAHER